MICFDKVRETGKILKVSRDEGARSRHDIWNDEREAARRKGAELFQKSSFRAVFDPQFDVTEITADAQAKTYGVHFTEPEWCAHLIPKRKFAHESMLEAAFPIMGNSQVAVSVTPEHIHAAFDACFAHPFVTKRFLQGGATGARLRITGDRLHWNIPELQQMVKHVRGNEPADTELPNWAFLIIDGKEPDFTSFYRNKDTGELIYEDKTKWPWEPVLLDKTGARKSGFVAEVMLKVRFTVPDS